MSGCATESVSLKSDKFRRLLLVCTGPRCAPEGEAQALFDTLGAKLEAAGLDAGEMQVKCSRIECLGGCDKDGPILCVAQGEGTWYRGVTGEVVDRIIEEHLIGGRPVAEHVFQLTDARRS